MRIKFIPFLTLLICTGLAVVAYAQTPAVKPSVVTGDVASISETKIVLKTKDGDLDVTLTDKTEFKKVPPDNPVLKAAVAATRADIGEGDKLLVTGIFGDDKKKLPARAVYLMTKSDIAQKQSKETERWATRGISGRVSAVNAPANQVTIEVRGMMNSTSVVVSPKGDAVFKRYAPNSVKYNEAVESSIADIKPGDMLRAVGDRNTEGTAFTAEEILTGAFQTVAGTVKTIDEARNEIIVADAQSKKDVTIALGPNSALKRFPEEMATRMAQFAGGGQGGIRPAGSGQPGANPGQGTPGQGRPGGAMRVAGGPRGGIDDMFERLPAIAITDLKPGDVIAVSSSKNGDAQHITAIKLLAGVEPFLRAAQTQASAGGRGGRGGQGAGFTIPGLDGFDN